MLGRTARKGHPDLALCSAAIMALATLALVMATLPTGAQAQGGTSPADVVPGEVLIRWTPEAEAALRDHPELARSGRSGLADLDALLAAAGVTSIEPALRFPPAADSAAGRRLRRTSRVCYAGAEPPAAMASQLMHSAHVELAEPNAVVHAVHVPDDTLFSSQWAHRNTGQAVSYGGAYVGVHDCDTDTELAWDATTGSPGILLAIIDSGIDLGHPEFAGRLVPGYDFYNNDPDPSDDHGHGTCCAGIAAAAGNNSAGVAGVDWQARILPVKVLSSTGQGNVGVLVGGIMWAADQGARVLSLSVGSYIPATVLEDAVEYAYEQGSALFCAAGNDNVSHLMYPAAYATHTVPIGALSPCGERKNPSSCDGENWWGSNYSLDLAFLTPGVRMHSTDIRGPGGYDPGDYTATFGGTSGATPHAAAIGSLVLSLNPSMSPGALKYILVRCAEDMYTTGLDPETGYGRLNAHLATLSAFAFPIYVDASHTGTEVGTLHLPYNTLTEGVNHVETGGTIVIFPGSYHEALTLTRAMKVIGKDGTATVGP